MDEPLPQNKLISYIALGINTLVVGYVFSIGQTINSTSLTVTRFDENIKTLSEQQEKVAKKLDDMISESGQVDKRVAQLEIRMDRLEKHK